MLSTDSTVTKVARIGSVPIARAGFTATTRNDAPIARFHAALSCAACTPIAGCMAGFCPNSAGSASAHWTKPSTASPARTSQRRRFNRAAGSTTWRRIRSLRSGGVLPEMRSPRPARSAAASQPAQSGQPARWCSSAVAESPSGSPSSRAEAASR